LSARRGGGLGPADRLLGTVLARRFEAVVLAWEGAVPDGGADAAELRRLVEGLCALGMDIGVVGGAQVGEVDRQLSARPSGPGRLHVAVDEGAEIHRVGPDGPELVWRRTPTPAEQAALTATAHATVARLAERGVRARVAEARPTRRTIDLLPDRAGGPPEARGVPAQHHRLDAAGFATPREVAELAAAAAAEAGLASLKVTGGVGWVEVALADRGDAAQWLFEELWLRGVSPGLVLVAGAQMRPVGGLPGRDALLLVPRARRATAVSVGTEPGGVPAAVITLGGGPDTLLGLLELQLRVWRDRRAPEVDDSPVWSYTVHGVDPQLERANESLLTLSDGRIGTRGCPLPHVEGEAPGVLASGVWGGQGPETTLLPAPVWNRLGWQLGPATAVRRTLDLRSGVLRQELRAPAGTLTAVALSSLARPGTVALRAVGPAELLQAAEPLAVPAGSAPVELGERHGVCWMRAAGTPGGVVAAARDTRPAAGTLERIGVYHPDPAGQPGLDPAFERLGQAERQGFDQLLAEHRAAWARRWERADIVVEGDDELQTAIRFALFHLMASTPDSGEAPVGARGLSGPAYRGHVFWDSDVFVLPFLAATHPAAARAMLEYRIARLPAARAAARRRGLKGARLPWESAADGFDVTPRLARNARGEVVPIRTGQFEEHITADVVWAAECYSDWTGDEAFRDGPGRALLVDTARYWASRVRFDIEGRAHIYGVIGPDEYHEPVDDSAFTNVMARWNLRRAAEAVAADPSGEYDFERLQWIEIADALVDGYDSRTGLYEEFSGFYDLEPLILQDIAPRRPIVADLLLGRDRVQGAQVVKQADVVMLQHMVPEEVAPGSLLPNLLFYEPRTAHGSSLSPGVHAAAFARAGRLEAARKSLDLAARIDIDDLTGVTAGGLHLATMGSVWQALVYGFAGLRPRDGVLQVDPRIPPGWDALEVRVVFRGYPLRLRATPGTAHIQADAPVLMRVPGAAEPFIVSPGGITLRRRGGRWEVQPMTEVQP
jgi:trehalose/maltose hydrolase-like predicted phosphorylase